MLIDVQRIVLALIGASHFERVASVKRSPLALAQYSLKPRDGRRGKAKWEMSVQVSRGRAGSAQGGDSDVPTETVNTVRPASEGVVVLRH